MSRSGGATTPWDIYVDERKVPSKRMVGFLEVPNTASLEHKLYRCREPLPGVGAGNVETREIHWNNLHRGVVRLALRWIDVFFRHRGTRFAVQPWPRTKTKEFVVLRHLDRFVHRKGLQPPFNVVVLLDYDLEHANSNIQNQIREIGQISRCYHFDGKRNNCLQLCDLLLGAVAYGQENAWSLVELPTLSERLDVGERLKNAECKRLVAGFLAEALDRRPKKIDTPRVANGDG